MLTGLFDFYNEMNANGVIFCSMGPLTQSVIEDLASTLRSKMEAEETGSSVSMKLFSVFIEQAQNIIHYSEEKVQQGEPRYAEYKKGICIIGQEEDGHYYVLSGNMIRNENVARIEQKIAIVQGMDAVELKAYYRKQRRKGPDEMSKGAGLGLIDMARRGKGISHVIKKVDDKHSFFSIKVVV